MSTEEIKLERSNGAGIVRDQHGNWFITFFSNCFLSSKLHNYDL